MINNAAFEDALSGLCKVISDSVKKEIENSLPCIVTKVSGDRTRVDVKPLIQIYGEDGSHTPRSEIKGLQVFTAGADGVLISFPIKVGDLGWIEASDRDISLFLQSYTDSRVNTVRKHSFSDAKFIPDIMRNFTINAEDSNAIVIQNRDGSVKVALDDSQIRIQNNDARIEMNSASIHATTSSVDILVDSSSMTGTAPGGFNLNGFTIDASGAAVSPVSITSPLLIAGSSITKAGVEVADGEHTHGPGSYSAGGDAVSGTSSQSNG